ncbi:3-oxoacyl-[acyl-carrier-protein] reductase [Bryocella elongata]|uniref:3-oxoacyl-[acyl-carrier-protein] reductase n=1 Tax=Bryocella elongata TaxID=863522 RepID=A0A1H5ZEL1_9BACT|nr:3-oxoacyl-[acyl-carrier-protein] reductase [Bryocella elongata]SEG34732.1 3-oxoacyl-[acyl-carrier-protein] reductase [Bryocella elongata]
MSHLNGKVALVTGASQGIGRAIALELAKHGATVALAARSLDKLESVAAEIVAAGGAAKAFTIDVTSEESIKAAAKAVLADLGAVHILVNNAGITRDTLALRMKTSDFEDVLRANLTGSFLLTQAVISSMMKARWGRIINITSVVGETGAAGQANYAASKAGLIGLTKSLAREFASRGITVNAIAPGFIQTAMTDVLTDAQKTGILAQVPLARYGAVEDIAAAAGFLASEGAGYITGHTLDVNGGLYMG